MKNKYRNLKISVDELIMNNTKQFEYENGFYLTAPVNRISKFATHLDLFRMTSGLPGEIVECGVFKGSSLSRFIKFRSLFENIYSRKIIAFDTFGEFPEAVFEDDKKRRDQFVAEAGKNSISIGDFLSVLQELELNQNIELVEGNILSTVPEFIKKSPHLKISLLHIDVDLYEPTKICLDYFFPKVVKNGIVILDDYGAFAGANKAIDEYFRDKDVVVERLSYSNAISFVKKCHLKKFLQ